MFSFAFYLKLCTLKLKYILLKGIHLITYNHGVCFGFDQTSKAVLIHCKQCSRIQPKKHEVSCTVVLPLKGSFTWCAFDACGCSKKLRCKKLENVSVEMQLSATHVSNTFRLGYEWALSSCSLDNVANAPRKVSLKCETAFVLSSLKVWLFYFLWVMESVPGRTLVKRWTVPTSVKTKKGKGSFEI